ncbi:probable cytochrome P450 6a13 [Wyeomyia smithii]|uniref:probable cytochrome P450 6a13 n=1 Tax=Wyeomyia smithii TaxID=174621 RepID=UPI002467FE97|nr:probable cytochrome P450 6a13 [Wyeomyia smithii]
MWIYFVLAAALLPVYWFRDRYAYWQKRGVPHLPGRFPFGNLQNLNSQHLSALAKRQYEQLKSPGRKLGGIFFFINPVAMALELDFVRDVLIKDFQYFHDRGLYYNEKDDPLTAHLLSLEGAKWKYLRSKLTPTFTSGKMKMMFPTVTAVAERFQQSLGAEAGKMQEIEIKDFLARYTTDVIGTCAFGLECNSLQDPQAKFRVMGRKAFPQGLLTLLKIFFGLMFRDVARWFGMRVLNKDVSDFFMGAVRDTIEYRETNNVRRNDFMDLLIELKNGDPSQEDQSDRLTFNQTAAQAFLFFAAGFETSSTVMTFCLFELANNQTLQDKARQNVIDVLKKHGSMTYEAVHDMKYLENCIHESLRKYPPIVNVFRNVTKPYKVADTDIVLDKRCQVMIPVHAIHHDPAYYPDPERFDPDRFEPEQTALRHPMTFIPFGDGPRSCIGLRFGMMQARIGMAHLLLKFRFRLGARVSVPLEIDPSSLVLSPKGGMWLNVEKI